MSLAAFGQEQHAKKEQEDRVIITYYTDPLCCWSWAFEPQWRRLRYEYGDRISWTYCLGGLIPDWKSYDDPMNSVSRPLQMGPLWLEASQVSGMPLRDDIWTMEPPASSYPACIAVKTARLQSAEACDVYLRSVREAVMIEGQDISKLEILFEAALLTEKRFPQIFDASRFETEYDNEASRAAFREDLMKVRFHKIGRFPTLTLSKPGQPGVIITGYRPYKVLLDALLHVAPEIASVKVIDAADYQQYWRYLTEREIEEVS